MRKLIILIIFTPTLSIAKTGLIRISPLYGFEKVYKIAPVSKTKTRAFYGVRAQAGPRILSVEAELTQSRDTELLASQNYTEKETTTQAKLGIRSGMGVGPLSFYLRAGGSAKKSKYEIDDNGALSTKEPAMKTYPYAGTGIDFRIMGFFVDAAITAVFTGEPKGSDYDTQTSLALGFRF